MLLTAEQSFSIEVNVIKSYKNRPYRVHGFGIQEVLGSVPATIIMMIGVNTHTEEQIWLLKSHNHNYLVPHPTLTPAVGLGIEPRD